MANFTLRSRTNNIEVIAGSFAPNGSSAVAATSNKGAGFTVARTGTGAFTITLGVGKNFTEMVACTLSLQLATPDGSVATPKLFTGGTTGTLTLETVNAAGTAADIAANASNRVNFVLWLRTSVRPS